MLRLIAAVLAALSLPVAAVAADDGSRDSECLAMAQAPPRAVPVNLRRAATASEEVAITYAGHSTYLIDTPGGVRIATDYNGAWRTGREPPPRRDRKRGGRDHLCRSFDLSYRYARRGADRSDRSNDRH